MATGWQNETARSKSSRAFDSGGLESEGEGEQRMPSQSQGKLEGARRSAEVANVLKEIGRPEIMSDYQDPNNCIPSTLVVLDVCRELGVQAEALVVEVDVESLDGSAKKRVGHRVDDRDTPDRWQGHLVAIVDGRFLLDLSIDQINTETWGFYVWPILATDQKFEGFLKGERALQIVQDKCRFIYWARVGDRTYQPGVESSRRVSTVTGIVNRIVPRVRSRLEGAK